MHIQNVVCTVILGLLTNSAMGVTLELSATADNGARFVEFRQDAFWELGQTRESTRVENPDGAFTYSELPSYTPQGGGGVAFPFQQNFLNLGTLEYDQTTGDITSLELDFAQYVAPGVFTYYQARVGAGAYTTSLDSFSGEISSGGGALPVVNLTSEIVFTIESAFDGIFRYEGLFEVIDNHFVLDVDDVQNSPYFETLFPGLGDVRLIWEVTGSLDFMSDVDSMSDFNQDGSVDAIDYAVWRENLGSQGPAIAGDANNDNVVDTSDFLLWKGNYGSSTNSDSSLLAATPEPATALLLGMLLVAASHRPFPERSPTIEVAANELLPPSNEIPCSLGADSASSSRAILIRRQAQERLGSWSCHARGTRLAIGGTCRFVRHDVDRSDMSSATLVASGS